MSTDVFGKCPPLYSGIKAESSNKPAGTMQHSWLEDYYSTLMVRAIHSSQHWQTSTGQHAIMSHPEEVFYL
jgi:hypothetical protein